MFKISTVRRVVVPSSWDRAGILVHTAVAACLALSPTVATADEIGCEAIRMEGARSAQVLPTGRDAARVELTLDRPGLLVLEGQSLGLAVDPCGGTFTGRSVEQSDRRWVIAFENSGDHAFTLRADSPVTGRFLAAEPVVETFPVTTRDRSLWVTAVDFYADGRHLAATIGVEDLEQPGAYRAELAYYLASRPESRSGSVESMLIARASELVVGSGRKIEEEDVDPNTGGFTGPWDGRDVPGSSAKIEEEDVDPNTGGFAGPSSGRDVPWSSAKIEEEDVDPNTGGFVGSSSGRDVPWNTAKIEEEDVDPNTGGFAGADQVVRTAVLAAKVLEVSGDPEVDRRGFVEHLLAWTGALAPEPRLDGPTLRLTYFSAE